MYVSGTPLPARKPHTVYPKSVLCRRGKILSCLRIVQEYRPDNRAMLQIHTFAAGAQPFCTDTFADFAISAAICVFNPLRTASHAVYGLGRNFGGIVQCAPRSGGLLSQHIVVVDGGYAGVARLAIQSATCDFGGEKVIQYY